MTKIALIVDTGGAGYIGSHKLVALLTEGYEAYVIDNISTEHLEALYCVKQRVKEAQ